MFILQEECCPSIFERVMALGVKGFIAKYFGIAAPQT
jgi:hypothetical protein